MSIPISGEYYRGTASFFGQYVSWSAHRYKGRNPDSSMGVLLQEDGGYIIVKHVNLCDEKLKNSLCVKFLKWKMICKCWYMWTLHSRKTTMCDYKVEVVFLIKPYVLYFRTAVFLWIPRVLNQSEDFGMFKLHIYMSMNVMNFLWLHYFICCSIWLHFSDEWILIFSTWKLDFNLVTTCALLCKML